MLERLLWALALPLALALGERLHGLFRKTATLARECRVVQSHWPVGTLPVTWDCLFAARGACDMQVSGIYCRDVCYRLPGEQVLGTCRRRSRSLGWHDSCTGANR